MKSIRTLLAAALAALAAPAAALAQGTSTLFGVVRDSAGHPIAAAEVRIIGTQLAARSDATGTITLDGAPAGHHWVGVRRLGFAPGRYALTIERNASRHLDATLVPLPQRLAPAVIEARSGYSGYMADFHERHKLGTGYFLTRDEIARMKQPDVVGLVRRFLPYASGFSDPAQAGRNARVAHEFRQAQRRSDALRLAGPRSAPVTATRCPPTVFVDGAPGGGWSLDDFRQDEIEGIEIYKGTGGRDIPREFRPATPATGCGLVVIWLRQGD